MINILIPSCGSTEFFENSYYPKTLYEVRGLPMIQHVIDNFKHLKDKHYIFTFLQSECDRFHTDKVAKLSSNNNDDIIVLKNFTGGALCTCLMAIEYINNDRELIISNNDQIIDVDFNNVVDIWRKNNADCGVICFNSFHPRWSYVRCDNGEVVETAEKKPISDMAIAGLYYFKHGTDFIKCAKSAILKGSTYNGKYYISAAVNEMILLNKSIDVYKIKSDDYHSFYTPERVRKYERSQVK